MNLGNAPNAADVPTLLGSGSFSLLSCTCSYFYFFFFKSLSTFNTLGWFENSHSEL